MLAADSFPYPSWEFPPQQHEVPPYNKAALFLFKYLLIEAEILILACYSTK